MNAIVCNARTLTAPLTGVQRYVREVLNVARDGIDKIAPSVPSQGLHGHAWEQLMLPRLLRKRLLWSPSNSGPLSVPRQVVTVHDLVPLEHPEWVGRRFGAWYRFMLPKLLHNVEHIIAVSDFTRGTIAANFPRLESRVTVIHNGVEARFSRRDAGEIERTCAALDIPSKSYVLSLCSLEPRKNLRRLLHAWRSLSSQVDEDVWLVLAGGRGSSRVFPALDLSDVPARVHFTGHVSDEHLPALLSGATVFVYPSLYEGFGLPPLEAMACGTPVITSRCTGMEEVIGDAGLLVDPSDVEALAAALLRVLSSSELRGELSRRGRERAADFSWQRAAERTLSVLKSVAEA